MQAALGVTETLARFVLETAYADIPPAVVAVAAHVFRRGAHAGARVVSQNIVTVRNATSELGGVVSRLANASDLRAQAAEALAAKMSSAGEVAEKLLEETRQAALMTEALVEQRRAAQAEALAVTEAIAEARKAMQRAIALHDGRPVRA